VKLPHLEEWNENRRQVAAGYLSLLEGRFSPPRVRPECVHNFHLFVIQSDERDHLQEHLREHQIESLIHYPIPCHLQRAFQNIAHRRGDLSVTERVAGRVLSLPMFPTLELDKVKYVSECVNLFAGKAR